MAAGQVQEAVVEIYDEGMQASAPDFIHGKPYQHSTGEVAQFKDNNWVIRHGRGQLITLYFGKLPSWLQRPAKLAIAHCWLEERRSCSYLLTLMGAYRRLSRWLPEFKGESMERITSEHETLLNKHMGDELARFYETLEAATPELEESLSLREKRRVCREAQLLGPKGINSFVSAFNLAARLSEEIDSFIIPIRLQIPHGIGADKSLRGVGSANTARVLTPEQLAGLEWALGKDLRCYLKARALLDRILGGLDLNANKHGKPDPIFDLERYFGLNGFEEHKASDVARLRGLSPASSMNVPQLIRRFLSKKIGPELASEIIRIRARFPRLNNKKRIAELEASRKYILEVLSKVDLSHHNQNAYCIERYFGLNGHRPHSLAAIAKQLNKQSERGVIYRIHKSLVALLGKTRAKRILAIRRRLLYYLTRAIKAQAIRVQLGTARRISAVLDVPVSPQIRIQTVVGRRIVEVKFRAGKTWGDEGMEEWIPSVDKFGEIVEDALKTAQELTKDLRSVVRKEDASLLFIIPDSSFECAVPLTTHVLHEYVYTNQKGKDAGILRRYALKNLVDFEPHDIRLTHSTHMIEAGGTIHDSSKYLSHFTPGGVTTMAGVFYLAGGTQEMRQRTAEALRRGAATGLQFDAVARLKIEAMGEEAKRVPVPPNQLSFEEARQRILTADIIEEVPAEPAEAGRLLHQNIIMNVTEKGGCILQAAGGHCPTANPCAIGIVRIGEDPVPGCGCKYLVLMPHSVDSLSSEVAVMDAQLKEFKGDEYAGWRVHTKAKRAHWQSLIEKAMALNPLVEGNQ